MLKIRLDQDLRDQSGKITITATPGNLAELIALDTELGYRTGVFQREAGIGIPADPEPNGQG